MCPQVLFCRMTVCCSKLQGRFCGSQTLTPCAEAIGDSREQCAQRPGDQQGDEGGFRAPGGILGAARKECDAVGNGNAEHNSGDDGDLHWRHCVACAPHHARETLSNGHGDISEGENLHLSLIHI